MELNPRISGKCQLILIPGETRDLKLAGVELYDAVEIVVEFLAGDEVVPIPVKGFYPEPPGVAISVPADIDRTKTWSGRIKLGGEVFCEFEVKLLDAELAKSLGWECPSK